MATRNTQLVSRPSFIVDENSIDRAHGHQIDWTKTGTAFINPITGQKVIPAGTLVVEADDGSKKVWPRTNETGALTASMILATNAIEGELDAALSGYGFIVGGVIYANLLPDYSHPDFATWWGELVATGTGWSRQAYGDDRV
jgi:hypothetical protein